MIKYITKYVIRYDIEVFYLDRTSKMSLSMLQVLSLSKTIGITQVFAKNGWKLRAAAQRVAAYKYRAAQRQQQSFWKRS